MNHTQIYAALQYLGKDNVMKLSVQMQVHSFLWDYCMWKVMQLEMRKKAYDCM